MKLRIKELRQQLGMSKKKFCEQAGVSQNTISLYERGGTPSIGQIEAIAEKFNVNPAWLIGWIEDEERHVMTVEKIVERPIEKIVYQERIARLPSYFKNDNAGKVIKWVRSRRFYVGRNK